MDFVEARLAEAHAEAQRQIDAADSTRHPGNSQSSATGRPELKLARLEAIRLAVADHERDRYMGICLTCRRTEGRDAWASEAWPCPTIRHIAAIWADHPAYDTTWTHSPAATQHPTRRGRRRASSGAWLHDVANGD